MLRMAAQDKRSLSGHRADDVSVAADDPNVRSVYRVRPKRTAIVSNARRST
jgi:hypothetical protein